MEKKPVLVLITASYPFGGVTEDAFVTPEITLWAERCEKVIIAPMTRLSAPPDNLSLPLNVEVTEELAQRMSRSFLRMRYAVATLLWRAVSDAALHGMSQRSAATFAAASIDMRNGIEHLIERFMLDCANTLFYTFWFDAPTVGLALLSQRRREKGLTPLRFITCVHGYELREIRSVMLKNLALQEMENCFAVSSRSADELRELFPRRSRVIKERRLGSRRPLEMPYTTAADDESGVIHIASIARMVDLKRVPLVFSLVEKIALAFPDRSVEWTHFGDGPGMMELTETLSGGMPQNLHVDLRGAVSNEEVHRYYVTHHVMWNVLLSTHEGGLPITLCEGASYGVPAIATAVGGIPELVDDSTGILLPVDFDLTDAVGRIVKITRDPARHADMSAAIKERWQQRYDAEKLRREFIDSLLP